MPKKNENRFADLTWNEVIDWAGKRIASRGGVTSGTVMFHFWLKGV
ncbi:MAG: hypothetical protein GQ565_07960 [Candidatus Aegiribacteria sp.]|nr:hypothetical protein [Candidatus Aegiribacteria sp.]